MFRIHYIRMATNLPHHSRPVTLRDIAARLEVDVATVSRALSGEAGVGKARMAEIRALARSMGYKPRPFRRKRVDAIGLVVGLVDSDTPNPGYFERMIYQAEVGAMRRGKHLHLHMLRSGDDGSGWPAFITENRVDGVVMLGHPPEWYYNRLTGESIPAVAVNDVIERTGTDCVLCDPTAGVSEAVLRLLALGHRSIGLVLTRRVFPTVSRRLTAYTDTLRQAGYEADPRWVVEEMPQGLRGGQQAIRAYVDSGTLPTSILFNDDWLAMGGVYELARQGVRVPDDVSIVGYDNTVISQELSPSLSSIDNQEQAIMERALEMLQQRINGFAEPPRQATLQSRLIWRESCARLKSR